MSRVLVVAGLGALLSISDGWAQQSRTFDEPQLDGRRLDLCLVWGGECGKPAADAWCREQGFDRAREWEPAPDIGAETPTLVLTDRRVCDGPWCDGFASITCERERAPLRTIPLANMTRLAEDRGRSWVDVTKDTGLIGQIYFPTGISDLDDAAYAELEEMQAYARIWTLPYASPMTFEFRGFADHRRHSGEGGNEGLSRERARKVLQYIREQLSPVGDDRVYSSKFRSRLRGYGVHPDSRPGLDLREFRRVDILGPPAKEPDPPPRLDLPRKPVLNDEWRARILWGGCLGPRLVEANLLKLEIVDPKNRMKMEYFLRTVGLSWKSSPVCAQGSSEYGTFRTSKPIRIQEFEGWATYLSVQPFTGAPNVDVVQIGGPYMWRGADNLFLYFGPKGLDPSLLQSTSIGQGLGFSVGGLHPVENSLEPWRPDVAEVPPCAKLVGGECLPPSDDLAYGEGPDLEMPPDPRAPMDDDLPGEPVPATPPREEGRPPVDTPTAEPWTTRDVIDERIDVPAQYALMRMFRGDAEARRAASGILAALERAVLAGVYREDQRAAALRARDLGTVWWELIPRGDLGVCVTGPEGKPPLVAMRRGAEDRPDAYEVALARAWERCGLPPAPPRPYVETLPPRPAPSESACASPSEGGLLLVRMYHADSGEPVPGKTVGVWSEDELVAEYRAQETGEVAFAPMEPGRYHVYVVASDAHEGASLWVDMPRDCLRTVYVPLVPEPE